MLRVYIKSFYMYIIHTPINQSINQSVNQSINHLFYYFAPDSTRTITIVIIVSVMLVGPTANLNGHYFQPILSVCVSLTGTSTLQR